MSVCMYVVMYGYVCASAYRAGGGDDAFAPGCGVAVSALIIIFFFFFPPAFSLSLPALLYSLSSCPFTSPFAPVVILLLVFLCVRSPPDPSS